MSANMLPTGEPVFARDLQQQLLAMMAQEQIPGALIHVDIPHSHRHTLTYIFQKHLPPSEWTIALGTSNLATNAPMNVKSHMRVGSITKTFTATLVLQLVDKGDFGLDDPVSNHLPAPTGPNPPWSWSNVPDGNTITIRQLLNMTSGLFNYTEDGNFFRQEVSNPTETWNPNDLVKIAFSHPPYFAPGQGWYYSNTNYILLGLLIEKVTGMAFENVFQQDICKPLKLHDTSMPARTSSAYS